jgi:hypothetical protein
VFALGVANGAFSIGAIGSMMRLANEGHGSREGVRMGLWGAAQAIAFGLGGLVGTGASDLARHLIASPGTAYAFVFALEALPSSPRPCWPGASRHRPQPAPPPVPMAPPSEHHPCAAGSHGTAPRAKGPGKHMNNDIFDVVVVGGGPAGATAAHELARQGRTVLLLDRAGSHQALRRRHPAPADPGLRDPRRAAGGQGPMRPHDRALQPPGGHPHRQRLRRHGQPRPLRRMAARARRPRARCAAPASSSAQPRCRRH